VFLAQRRWAVGHGLGPSFLVLWAKYNKVRANKKREKLRKNHFFLDFFLRVQKKAVPLHPQMRNKLV